MLSYFDEEVPWVKSKRTLPHAHLSYCVVVVGVTQFPFTSSLQSCHLCVTAERFWTKKGREEEMSKRPAGDAILDMSVVVGMATQLW